MYWGSTQPRSIQVSRDQVTGNVISAEDKTHKMKVVFFCFSSQRTHWWALGRWDPHRMQPVKNSTYPETMRFYVNFDPSSLCNLGSVKNLLVSTEWDQQCVRFCSLLVPTACYLYDAGLVFLFCSNVLCFELTPFCQAWLLQILFFFICSVIFFTFSSAFWYHSVSALLKKKISGRSYLLNL